MPERRGREREDGDKGGDKVTYPLVHIGRGKRRTRENKFHRVHGGTNAVVSRHKLRVSLPVTYVRGRYVAALYALTHSCLSRCRATPCCKHQPIRFTQQVLYVKLIFFGIQHDGCNVWLKATHQSTNLFNKRLWASRAVFFIHKLVQNVNRIKHVGKRQNNSRQLFLWSPLVQQCTGYAIEPLRDTYVDVLYQRKNIERWTAASQPPSSVATYITQELL